jgi:hypothetical protein
MFLPSLSDTEKKVLMALLDRNNIAGYDLMSMTGGNFDELRDAVANLRRNELIQVVGSSSTEKDRQRTYQVRHAGKRRSIFLIRFAA